MKIINNKNFYFRVILNYFKTVPNFKALINYVHYKIVFNQKRYSSKTQVMNHEPVSATIWLTSSCNMTCKFCHYNTELYPATNNEHNLDFEKFKAQYERHSTIHNALRFSLYGGEPLLNPDWALFVEFLKGKGHLVSINTNGILLEENFEKLLKRRPDFLSVSYYPENSKILDKILPKISGLIPIRLNFMVTPKNFHLLENVFELAKKWKVSMIAIDNYVPNGNENLHILEMKNGQQVDINSSMSHFKKNYGNNFVIEWNVLEIDRQKTHCSFFWNSIFINEEGKVNPCSVWSRKTFVEMDSHWWNGDEMQNLRNKMQINQLPKECQNCDCAYTNISGF